MAFVDLSTDLRGRGGLARGARLRGSEAVGSAEFLGIEGGVYRGGVSWDTVRGPVRKVGQNDVEVILPDLGVEQPDLDDGEPT